MCYILVPQYEDSSKKTAAAAVGVQTGHWGYTASSQAAHWDPLQPPCRQNHTFCTLKEVFHPKPIPLPTPSLMGTQNLHTETRGQCHSGLPPEHTHHCLSRAWTSLLCIQVLLEPIFSECCEGAASTARNRTALPEPPQSSGEHNIPVHNATCSSSGRTGTKHFPTAPWKRLHTNTLRK